MNHAHVAFVSFPLPPHVNPTFPIVNSLVRRGHRVTYVCSDRFADKIQVVGAEFISSPQYRFEAMGGTSTDSICEYSRATLGRIELFYRANRPNVIIYDSIAFAGRILASRESIAAIGLTPHFAFEKSVFSRQLCNPRSREIALTLSRRVNQFLHQYGVESQEFLFYREKLDIYTFPKEFEPVDNMMDPRCFYAGRCAGESSYFGTWEKGEISKPIALVTTSTTTVQSTDYFRLFVDALTGSQWHVILSIGDEDNPEDFQPLPGDFQIVQRVPHTKILPHASFIICMGGIITSAEAAYHGVPIVVTSCRKLELEALGDNIERLGICVHLKHAEMSVTNVRKAAIEVTTNSVINDTVKRLQRDVRRGNGGEETANRIEDYIDESC